MRSGLLVEIVTTAASEADALALANALVRERFAACANVSAIRSVYRWSGEIREEPEFEIRLKTTASRALAAERRLREIHPYETPAVLRLPVLAADDDYAAWVEDCVDPGAGIAEGEP